MTGFGTRAVTAQQMRDLDRRATEEFGIPSILLMENAGRAIFDTAVGMLGDIYLKRVVVVAGPGNNGGDGFVAARFLHNAGADVVVAYYGDRAKAKGDALTNIEIAEKIGLEIDYSQDTDALRQAVRYADLVIDALLGTGVKGELRPDAAKVVGIMNRRNCPLLAVDIPSGIDADTGESLGPALSHEHVMEKSVMADTTVTFALPKLGLVTESDGAWHTGDLVIAEIGIPNEAILTADGPITYLLDRDYPDCLPPRGMFAHKGELGHLAIIAGSAGMTGAATLAAEGALRIGTGLVTVAVPESLNDIMEVKLTEAMTIPVPEGNSRAFGMASLDKVLEIIDKRDAAVIGPGFGRNDDTIAFTLELIRRLNKPVLIDADGLFAISRDLSVLKMCKQPIVITPHPGEMAMLLGTDVAQVQSNRIETARSFAKEYGVTVVLKGARTVIAEPDGMAFINMSGTPGMATGGTGDVLSGMIGGLLAREPYLGGICKAVYLHGRAGELAAEELGVDSMLATDLANHIGAAIIEDESDESERE
ncbi:MAG: NAD(P)H-hydrate dehydratase [Armatimonadota bacterium]|nr:NAD(P)H-hydrate dehydratase [bacterium]